jgi:hypothetical protein
MRPEIYSSHKVVKPFCDDDKNQISVGMDVVIVDFLGPTDYIVEIAHPDDTLVGGHRFSTACIRAEHIGLG